MRIAIHRLRRCPDVWTFSLDNQQRVGGEYRTIAEATAAVIAYARGIADVVVTGHVDKGLLREAGIRYVDSRRNPGVNSQSGKRRRSGAGSRAKSWAKWQEKKKMGAEQSVKVFESPSHNAASMGPRPIEGLPGEDETSTELSPRREEGSGAGPAGWDRGVVEAKPGTGREPAESGLTTPRRPQQKSLARLHPEILARLKRAAHLRNVDPISYAEQILDRHLPRMEEME